MRPSDFVTHPATRPFAAGDLPAIKMLVLAAVLACLAGTGRWSRPAEWFAGASLIIGLVLLGARLWPVAARP